MLHELRIYHCVPGRLPDLNKRFETITLKLWEKHGIRPVAFWTTYIGESNNVLTYLLAWESLAEREKKWAAFATDPEWLEITCPVPEDLRGLRLVDTPGVNDLGDTAPKIKRQQGRQKAGKQRPGAARYAR